MASDTKDVVPSHYREKYRATGGGCGDFIATRLSKIAQEGVMALNTVKRENGIDEDKWSSSNAGMVRMNLANTLRARYLKGETIKILGREYNVLHQVEDFNGVLEDNDRCLSRVCDLLDLNDEDRIHKSLRKLLFPAG